MGSLTVDHVFAPAAATEPIEPSAPLTAVRAESSSIAALWSPGLAHHALPTASSTGPSLFAGGQPPPPALFDFGALLGKIVAALVGQPAPQAAQAPAGATPSTSTPPPPADTQTSSTSVHAQGQTTIGDTTFAGTADAKAYATTTSSSQTFAGPEGVGVKGAASAQVGVSATASGTVTSSLGTLSGTAGCSAEAYARAQGYACANEKGATAEGSAEVGAHVEAHANADAVTADGLVTGHADAIAEAGTGAKADAKVGVSADPPTAAVDASGGAFAGARAGFHANGGVAGMKYGVSGEAWAGVGVKADVHAGMSDGKFKFSFGIGVACGVGGFLKFDFEIDFNAIGRALGNFFGGHSDSSAPAKGATQVLGDWFQRLPETRKKLEDVDPKYTAPAFEPEPEAAS
jgi:hypothetical protein